MLNSGQKNYRKRKTRRITVRDVPIGDCSPVTVQSMLSVPTTDIDAALKQIRELQTAGCDIIRIAIPDSDSVEAFRRIRAETDSPLVADIHFDHRLAIEAANAGADKLRINPGNIGSVGKVKEVAAAAKDLNIPIRIGVNAGSLPKDLSDNEPMAEKMLEAASREIDVLLETGFEDIVVSLKAHHPVPTVEANRLFSEKYGFPLHLGVTEAGLPGEGGIRSAVGIGTLLMEGIGDTIRVSLTGNPVREVVVGRQILRACGLLESGIELVSCPTCGRCKVDVEKIASEVLERLPKTDKHLVVAIMGCEVNGPGEAKMADIGIAGGDGFFLMFKKGEPFGKIAEAEAVERLLKEIEGLIL